MFHQLTISNITSERSVDISMTHNEKTRLGKFGTHKTDEDNT